MNKLTEAKTWYQKAAEFKIAIDQVKENAIYKLALIDYWEGNFDNALARVEHITKTPVIFRNDKSGLFINDALELSMFINENRQQPEILKAYSRSMLLIEQFLFDEAQVKLRNLLSQQPNSTLADDIGFKIAEVENEKKRDQGAIQAYQYIIDKYPDSRYCALAQKQIGEIYEKRVGDIGKAIGAYELILSKYPDSPLLDEVRKRIRELEKTSVR